MKQLLSRHKNTIVAIINLGVLAYELLQYFTGKIDIQTLGTNVGIAATISVTIIGLISPDGKTKNAAKIVALFIVASFLLFSCKSTEKNTISERSYIEKIDSVYRPIKINIPKKSVETSFAIDLADIYIEPPIASLDEGTVREKIVYNNDSTLILKAQADSLGNFILSCEATAQTYEDSILTLNRQIKEYLKKKEKEVVTREKTFLGFARSTLITIGLIAFIALLIFINLKKRNPWL